MEDLNIRDILQPMTSNLEGIGRNFQLLEDQSLRLATVDSLPASGIYELQNMQEKLQVHEDNRRNGMSDLKMVAKEIRPQVEGRLRAGIKGQVRSAIKAEVNRQVGKQITGYVPIPLDKLVDESRKQLAEVRIALENSEARRQNAALDMATQYEPLAPILTDSGERSGYLPADLGSLFSYDVETLRALVRSYGLQEDNSADSNCRRFLEFIGAKDIYLEEGGFSSNDDR